MTEKQIISGVEEYMSSVVRERGYYNILTAVTYAGDKNPKFNDEGTKAKDWRSDVYVKLYELLDNGETDLKAIIEKLPKLNW